MKIALVDDDPDLIEVVYLALSQAGHDVITSPAGATAIPALRENPPDILITDLMMAEVDGLELCDLVKASPQLTNMKVIFISARTGDLWKQKAKDCGAAGFIEKPIDPITFAAKVEQIAAHAV